MTFGVQQGMDITKDLKQGVVELGFIMWALRFSHV